MTLFIKPNGNIECLYSEEIDLSELGTLTVQRASHVEFNNEKQLWEVRLVNSGVLGYFKTRREALDFEIEVLNKRIQNDTIDSVLERP